MKLFYILSLIVAGVAGHGGSRRANRGLASLSTEEKRLHNGARYAKIIQACSEQLGFGSKFKITVGSVRHEVCLPPNEDVLPYITNINEHCRQGLRHLLRVSPRAQALFLCGDWATYPAFEDGDVAADYPWKLYYGEQGDWVYSLDEESSDLYAPCGCFHAL